MKPHYKKYTWEDLAKLGTPNQWMSIYADYSDLLVNEKAANWFANELDICCKERIEIKTKINNLQARLNKLYEQIPDIDIYYE